MGASAAAVVATIVEGASAAAATTAGQAAIGGVASATAGAALSKALAPSVPGAKAPTPLPDQAQVDAAKRRSLAAQQSRRGRASTILTDEGDTLG